jgi:hypothetical protein
LAEEALDLPAVPEVFAENDPPVLRKKRLELSARQLYKMLRVNKLDETQSVQHRIFITEAPAWRIATVR